MLWLCTGHRPRRIYMSANHRYFPEHLISKAEIHQRNNQQISLELGREHFVLTTDEEVKLAGMLVASYHNQYVCRCGDSDYEDLDWVDNPDGSDE